MAYHNRLLRAFQFLLCIQVCFLCFSYSVEATISYGDRSGTTIDFININETNNSPDRFDQFGNEIPLFEAPIVSGNQLYFFPTQFSSASIDGASDVTTSTLQFQLRADPGTMIETVRIQEFGDYLLTGDGTAATQADASLYLTVTPLAPSGEPLIDQHFYDFELPLDSSGGFNLTADIVFDTPVTLAMVQLNNNLSTTSESGTTSFIQKKVVDGPAVGILVNPVPVPGAAWLLVSGVVGLVAVRKASENGKREE